MIKPLLAVGLLGFAAQTPAAAELKAVRVGARIDVSVGSEFFTSYHFRDDEKYPFFFPVNGPSGAAVTSMRNGRYPHHASPFFGCDQVNGGNYWQDGLERGQIRSEGPVIVTGAGPEIVITDACRWARPGAPSPFRDTRWIVIAAPTRNLRRLDFEITLEPLEDVTIAKTNHSLFSVRLDPDLAPAAGGKMFNAAGASGEKGTFGQPSPWLAAYGRRGTGPVEGLALFQHPANGATPARWFTRDYGFLSPTPMFWPADGAATRLRRGERLTLRYRVLVFTGEPAPEELARWSAAYAAGANP